MTDHFAMDADAKIRDALEQVRQTARLLAELQHQEPLNAQAARAQIAHMVTDPKLTLDDWSWSATQSEGDHRETIEVTFTMSRTGR